MAQLKENRNKILGGIALSVLIFMSFSMVYGFEMFEINEQCHTETVNCKGMPFGNSCIGNEASQIEFHDECGDIETIQNQCAQVRDQVCEGDGYEWMENVEVRGFSCATWNEQYNLEMAACPEG